MNWSIETYTFAADSEQTVPFELEELQFLYRWGQGRRRVNFLAQCAVESRSTQRLADDINKTSVRLQIDNRLVNVMCFTFGSMFENKSTPVRKPPRRMGL